MRRTFDVAQDDLLMVAATNSGAGERAAGDIAPFSLTHKTTLDVEEQAACLREWTQVYEQMSPGPFEGRLQEICFPGVQLFREKTSQSVHESGAPWRGSRAIGVPLFMESTGCFRSETVDAETVVTLGPDDELDFYTPRGFEILGLVVDAGALEMHAREVQHRELAEALDGKSVLKPGGARFDELRRLLLSVLHSSEVNPTALRFRQTQKLLEQTMLGAIFAVCTDDEPAPAKPACAGRHYVVDAARAFMRSHVAEPITVADLCLELGVSRRTLQYCFQDVLGINPVRFLRALRLNGVRRDLKAAPHRDDSIQDVAARWGFWHLGHFVTDYKRMFGELPSETRCARRTNSSSIPAFNAPVYAAARCR